MTVSSTEGRIHRSAYLLAELAQQLTLMLKEFKAADPPFYVQYLLYFLVYAKRQIEAICVLMSLETHPIYAEQAGQLLRVLIELSIKLAWMMNPGDSQQRDYRAWQFEKDSIVKERLSDAQERELLELAGVTRYEEQESSLKGLPNLRQMADEVDPDYYDSYRQESSKIHLSTRTLNRVIGPTYHHNGHYNIQVDSPDDPATRALVLLLTLILIDRISKNTLPWLDLDTAGWTEAITSTHNKIDKLLRPLLESITGPLS